MYYHAVEAVYASASINADHAGDVLLTDSTDEMPTVYLPGQRLTGSGIFSLAG